MRQPSINQMRARLNEFHRLVLWDVRDGTHQSGLTNVDIRAYLRAQQTLFRWGCLKNGPMERAPDMTTSYPVLLTERGKELLGKIR